MELYGNFLFKSSSSDFQSKIAAHYGKCQQFQVDLYEFEMLNLEKLCSEHEIPKIVLTYPNEFIEQHFFLQYLSSTSSCCQDDFGFVYLNVDQYIDLSSSIRYNHTSRVYVSDMNISKIYATTISIVDTYFSNDLLCICDRISGLELMPNEFWHLRSQGCFIEGVTQWHKHITRTLIMGYLTPAATLRTRWLGKVSRTHSEV